MAKKNGKHRSGNPRKRVAGRCIHCRNEPRIGWPKPGCAVWCRSCSDLHRERGRYNRPSPERVEATVRGLARHFGLT